MSVSVTGTISDVSYDAKGLPKVTITVNERNTFLTAYDDLSDTKLSIDFAKYRSKRSNDANAYAWVLCGKIAEKVEISPREVYRDAILQVGVYRDFHNFDEKEAKSFRHAWELLGIGWLTEQVDYDADGEHVVIRAYYGSSTYNTKQMSRLIEWLVTDAQTLDIETKTPDEINNMLSLWETQRQ